MSVSKHKLVIVEDDEGLCGQLKWCFPDQELIFAEDRVSAVEAVAIHAPAVVLLDLGLPPDPANASEGLAALREILDQDLDVEVIVITGNEQRAVALECVASGAYDFYAKPVEPDELRLIVDRALRWYELQQENRRLVTGSSARLEGIITGAPAMLEVCGLIERVAPSGANVMLLGESGTGKELLARSVHRLSDRASERFVAINCASIPEALLESELFGYEKGAFTGAASQTIGKIEYAHGGTLFLDEVGDLPLALQAKLLRFLQERVIERLGGRGEIPVDVRVVGATHRDLSAMMAEGTFREDLYYRLCEINIEIPPLRERIGDAALLAHAFRRHYATRDGRGVRGFSTQALARIESHHWPGNVRELENVIRRAVILCHGVEIDAATLGIEPPAEDDREGDEPLRLRTARERAERDAVTRALGLANGNIARASDLLGVSRPTLYTLLDKFGLRAA